MTPITRRASLALMASAAAFPARAERLFLDGMGVAIRGYDPVAYFEFQEAVRGNLDNALETKEGIWYFSRPDFREKFEDNPDRYMPQFGGWDAEGMARGFKRRSDPTLWILIDNKIYRPLPAVRRTLNAFHRACDGNGTGAFLSLVPHLKARGSPRAFF